VAPPAAVVAAAAGAEVGKLGRENQIPGQNLWLFSFSSPSECPLPEF